MQKGILQSFSNQFVALMKGDDAAVTAEKVFRKRQSALNTHYHNATGDLVDTEDAVSEAEDNLLKARLNNGEEIEDRNQYVIALISAYEAVKDAKEELAEKKALIKFLKDEQNFEMPAPVVAKTTD